MQHHLPDARLESALRFAVFAGLLLSALLPWRSQVFGFIPLWLLGMPLAAWWALHRFPLPRRHRRAGVARRRPGVQARRRVRAQAHRVAHAA